MTNHPSDDFDLPPADSDPVVRAAKALHLYSLSRGSIPLTAQQSEDHARQEKLARTLSEQRRQRTAAAVNQVIDEFTRAVAKFGPQRSAHEGYAVLLEEVDELWDEVKKNDKIRLKSRMLAEAKQVAAMAIRFMVDVCGDAINLPGPEGVTFKDRRVADRRGTHGERRGTTPLSAPYCGPFRRLRTRSGLGDRRKVNRRQP